MSAYDDDLLGDPVDLDDIVENYGGQDVDDNDDNNDNDIDNNVPSMNDDAEGTTSDRVAVQPKKKVIREKRPVLDPNRLRGERGIATMEKFFKNFKYNGKGHEKQDLDTMMSYMQYWCHQLYPKYQFDDCLEKIEKLGHKKVVQTYIRKIRQDMIEDPSADDNVERGPEVNAHSDEENHSESTFANVSRMQDEIDEFLGEHDLMARNEELFNQHNNRASSSQAEISEEMRRKIMENKQKALEKRMARLQTSSSHNVNDSQTTQPHDTSLDAQEISNTEITDPDPGLSLNSTTDRINQSVDTDIPMDDSSTSEILVESASKSPFTTNTSTIITDEQRERMIRNRKKAEEMKLAKFKASVQS